MRNLLLTHLFATAFLGLSAVPSPAQAGNSREITFASGSLTIPGTLRLPDKPVAGGAPVVLLVQGSGPSDRDETIGPNQPFHDLAEGLAAHGVATLRYDKRTWLMAKGRIPMTAADLARVSLATEVVDDAVAALGFAASQPGIDPHRIFVLGHSLGGSLAPRILSERLKQQPGSVRGSVEMSGAAMPANLILPYQTAFQALLHGKTSEATQKDAAVFAGLFSKAMDTATPADEKLVFAPAGYFREWAALDPAAALRALSLPALVLHGKKDVQVLYTDYVLLASAARTPGSQAQEFDGLNHLMMPVSGESTGAEYATASHVAPQVILAMADWIAAVK